jgi:hypothetical protein
MKKSKRWSPNNLYALIASGVFLMSGPARAFSSNADLTMSKDLVGPTGGVALQGGDYSLNFSWGEGISGVFSSDSKGSVAAGYLGAGFGAGQNFAISETYVGTPPGYFQDGFQIGVPVTASVRVTFSDEIDTQTISAGVTATILRDNLANSTRIQVPFHWSYDPSQRTLTLLPESAWQGNSLLDITVAPEVRSINAYSLGNAEHIQFMTMANPHEQNVILNAVNTVGGVASLGTSGTPSLRVDIPAGALSDYSVLLFNSNPQQSPWRVSSEIIQEANRKARAAGGAYEVPIGLTEIVAFNSKGQALGGLSQTAHVSISFDGSHGWVNNTAAPVRTSTLSLWTLDTEHRLWVKIPASSAAGSWLVAPVTRLSVFAVMGSPAGSASDVYVFPIPWRPFGPDAGTGAGQTGTESDGMTFSNLPSECTIKIYTLNGQLVRELHHSDTAGLIAQEKWDGHTAGGAPAASGVYLWRVASAQDGKNGKLMIIR